MGFIFTFFICERDDKFALPEERKKDIFAVPNGDDSVAQLVEHNTFNVGALGSSPSGITYPAREILAGFFF